jgi:2',3'-cyclic-nucleotide 2'-phosphodiesterase (5'-nucleotidase family)
LGKCKRIVFTIGKHFFTGEILSGTLFTSNYGMKNIKKTNLKIAFANIAKAFFSSFLLVVLVSCKTTSRIDHYETADYHLNKPGYTTVDSSIYKSFLPYKNIVDSSMGMTIAISEIVLEKNQPEGLLGDLVADMVLEEAKKNYYGSDDLPVQFCFLNNGGLRAPLPKGEITKRNVFELMPFENEMVVITVNGNSAKKLFDFIATKDGMPVSGVTMKIKNHAAENILIDGVAFDSSKNYKVVTSDYLASGGDNLTFLKDEKKEYIGIKLRDAIINNMMVKNKKGITITTKLDGRISYDK